MRGPRPWARSLRFRIAMAFILGALVLSGLVAGSTYGLARAYLTRQRVDAVLRQSFNTLRFATEYLARADADRSLETLASLLHVRGTADVVLVEGGRTVTSSVSVTVATPPEQLVRAVEADAVGYSILPGRPRRAVFGSPVPQTEIDVFLVFSLQELDQTLAVVARVLLGVVGGAMAAASVAGLRLARLTIEPLRRASEAAQRVAEGLIETRLEEAGDELGMLAGSFNSMAQALQQRMALERRFVADASHELRTPLTALRASVDYLMAHEGELPERLRSTAALASREVHALQRLVNDLLELSRMEAGAVDVGEEEIELGHFSREVARHRAREHEVSITAPEDGLVVRTDKLRLERVVGNLLENAVSHGQARSVRLEAGVDGGRPSIVVRDDGPGIPTADLPRIFERFWRGDHARRRGSGGSGLGLAIAGENAALLGATLDVQSSEGEGTQVTVWLPAAAYVGPRRAEESGA